MENNGYERLINLSQEELEGIFAQLSMSEIDDLLEKLHEGDDSNE